MSTIKVLGHTGHPYEIQPTLIGKWSYGVVYECLDLVTQEMKAAKIIY